MYTAVFAVRKLLATSCGTCVCTHTCTGDVVTVLFFFLRFSSFEVFLHLNLRNFFFLDDLEKNKDAVVYICASSVQRAINILQRSRFKNVVR